MKTSKQLCREIFENGEMREAYADAEQNHTIAEFLKEQGVEEDEMLFLKALRESTPQPVALSDDQMAQAVGGVDYQWGSEGYTKNVHYLYYEFDIGERVHCWGYSGYYDGVVREHGIYNSGMTSEGAEAYYYPYYMVQLDGYGPTRYKYWQNWLAKW